MKGLLAFLLLLPFLLGAGKTRYGGTLKVVLGQKQLEAAPLLADTPEEAALLLVRTAGACRLVERALQPSLLETPEKLSPLSLRWSAGSPSSVIEPAPFIPSVAPQAQSRGTPSGAPSTALGVNGKLNGIGPTRRDADVLALASLYQRILKDEAASPYRALLFPLREDQRLERKEGGQQVELSLAFAWPDFEASLCHPALSLQPAPAPNGRGPFLASAPESFDANLAFPRGRPFLDRLVVSLDAPRAAAKQLALRQAQLLLGTSAGAKPLDAPPLLHATYLAFRPQAVGSDFRSALEAVLDRAELTRFFVPMPAAPMSALLPPALMTQEPMPKAPAPQKPLVPRAVSLAFDASVEEHRAVAERLQVKLHDQGYKITLEPLARAALRAKNASGTFDLLLMGILLPPLPAPALAVVLETARRRDLLSLELPPIGALALAAARAERVKVRAEKLLPSLSLIPLYARGIRMRALPNVEGLTLDAQGLPLLDDVSLRP